MAKIEHIQGIRCLAIVAVVLFHFIPWHFPNAFLGVDIFFVLSGYLMAKIMAKEGKLTWTVLANFWYRRIKRIFPLYYFVIFLSTASLLIFSVPNLPGILDSMINSVFFATNLQQFTGFNYFLKLSAFFDLFTHTWSLCVEVQFYLIFPLLHFVDTLLPLQASRYSALWIGCGAASLYFHLHASDHVAFNCVLARLWHFTVGILTFNLSREKKTSAHNFLVSMIGLCIIGIMVFSKYSIPKSQARILVSISTPLLLTFGEGNLLLQNKFSVLVGEVSYAWYLVHWPIVCYQRNFDFNRLYDYPSFISVSFVLAVAVHFAFEKHYLKWNYYLIFVSILLLAFGSISMYLPLSGITPRDIKKVRELSRDYGNLTKDEVIKLNTDLFNLDIPLLGPENCAFDKPPLLNWQGFCQYEELFPQRGNNTLMVIGNSWAANVIKLIYAECSPFAKNISYYSVSGCDVLPDVINSCQITPQFVEHVERIRPDVLFIVSRAIDLKHVDDGMLPLDDSVFAASQRKLEMLEPLVRKKIYILNAFHNINPRITTNVNKWLRGGQTHPKDSSLDPPNGLLVARMRTEELVRRCKKCELMDYVPYLSVNHRVTLYDPEKFVTFANSVQHLTLAGQEKIRPMYRELCQRLHTF